MGLLLVCQHVESIADCMQVTPIPHPPPGTQTLHPAANTAGHRGTRNILSECRCVLSKLRPNTAVDKAFGMVSKGRLRLYWQAPILRTAAALGLSTYCQTQHVEACRQLGAVRVCSHFPPPPQLPPLCEYAAAAADAAAGCASAADSAAAGPLTSTKAHVLTTMASASSWSRVMSNPARARSPNNTSPAHTRQGLSCTLFCCCCCCWRR